MHEPADLLILLTFSLAFSGRMLMSRSSGSSVAFTLLSAPRANLALSLSSRYFATTPGLFSFSHLLITMLSVREPITEASWDHLPGPNLDTNRSRISSSSRVHFPRNFKILNKWKLLVYLIASVLRHCIVNSFGKSAELC